MARVREYWGGTRVMVSPVAWVDAAPFRAHVLQLMAWGEVTVEEFAELALVSRRAVRRLVHGRDDGRPVRRICPYVARRVLRIGPDDVRHLDRQLVPTAAVIEPLVDLLRDEGRVDVLAGEIGAEAAELWSVIHGARECSRLLAVRIRVAGEELMARQFAARPFRLVPTDGPPAEVVTLSWCSRPARAA